MLESYPQLTAVSIQNYVCNAYPLQVFVQFIVHIASGCFTRTALWSPGAAGAPACLSVSEVLHITSNVHTCLLCFCLLTLFHFSECSLDMYFYNLQGCYYHEGYM